MVEDLTRVAVVAVLGGVGRGSGCVVIGRGCRGQVVGLCWIVN